jgi:hypothetical protein
MLSLGFQFIPYSSSLIKNIKNFIVMTIHFLLYFGSSIIIFKKYLIKYFGALKGPSSINFAGIFRALSVTLPSATHANFDYL